MLNTSGKALVLLVDDCAETRGMYAECLSTRFEIVQAGTGREALTKASELHPSAIVMDLMLPDMLGMDVILRLKRDARTDLIPVVVLSGHAEPVQKSAPWDFYLVKPCWPAALSECLDRMLEHAAAS
jgi:CheY-like chemotaxis protein